MKILAAALDYREMGLSVIPVGKDKKPLIKWESYQKQKASEHEIKAWFDDWPEANVGIVTGAVSRIAVIDLDEPEKARPVLEELIPDSMTFPISSTPSGGEHWYFTCNDSSIRNNARVIPGADLRAEGGYVVAPPSVNGNGIGYTWVPELKISNVIPPPLPPAYISYINNNAFNKGDSKGVFKGPVAAVALSFDKGSRNDTLFHVANSFVKSGMPETETLQILTRLASTCNPPFPPGELQTILLSASKRREHREINLTGEIESYIWATDGDFSATECYNVLQNATWATKCDMGDKRRQNNYKQKKHKRYSLTIEEQGDNSKGRRQRRRL